MDQLIFPFSLILSGRLLESKTQTDLFTRGVTLNSDLDTVKFKYLKKRQILLCFFYLKHRSGVSFSRMGPGHRRLGVQDLADEWLQQLLVCTQYSSEAVLSCEELDSERSAVWQECRGMLQAVGIR